MAGGDPSEPRPRWVLTRYVAAATLARTADGGGVVAIVLIVTTSGGPGGLAGLLGASITAPHLLGPFVARRLDTAPGGRNVIALAFLIHGATLAATVLLYPHTSVAVPALLLILSGLVGPFRARREDGLDPDEALGRAPCRTVPQGVGELKRTRAVRPSCAKVGTMASCAFICRRTSLVTIPRRSRAWSGRGRGWVIMNAFDGADPEMRRLETERQVTNLAGVGLVAREPDLRAHDAESLSAKFGQPDFLWVRGGNVFTLRATLARSGADALIADRLRADELVYAGFSAGACVRAPSLLGLEECDSTEDALSMYGAVEFDGLSILDRPFVPHLGSPEHPESEALTRVAAAYAQEGKPYWALRDGQALVVDGSSVVLL